MKLFAQVPFHDKKGGRIGCFTQRQSSAFTDPTTRNPLMTGFQREAMATLFRLAPSTDEQSSLITTFLAPLPICSSTQDDVTFPFEIAQSPFREHFLQFSPHARLAVYRGLIISLPREVITSPFTVEYA